MAHIVHIVHIAHTLRHVTNNKLLDSTVNQISKKNTVTFEEKVFQLETIKRALYRLADSGSFDISCREGEISVVIHASHETIDDLTARIRNEVIDQDLRDTISKETSNIRTLILANAFSNTGLIES